MIFFLISRIFLMLFRAKNALVDRINPRYVFVMVAFQVGSVLDHDLENVKISHFFHRFGQEKSRISPK